MLLSLSLFILLLLLIVLLSSFISDILKFRREFPYFSLDVLRPPIYVTQEYFFFTIMLYTPSVTFLVFNNDS